MSQFFHNVGLQEVFESEQALDYIVSETFSEGSVILGYYGYPYINHHFGDVQVVLRTELKEETEKQCNIVGIDTHCSGSTVWNVMVLDALTEEDREAELKKTILVTSAGDQRYNAVIEVVNADVLPSYRTGEYIRLQMIAFPQEIHYFDTLEEAKNAEFIEAYNLCPDIEAGNVLPRKYQRKKLNTDAEGNTGNADEYEDNYGRTSEICGTVEHLSWGTLKIGDKTYRAFVLCRINTQYGKLDIAHAINAVSEAERDKVRLGATVRCLAVLSGDAAIYEYDNGIIRDMENNLKVLAYSMENGDVERLRSVLTEDICYISERSRKELNGMEAVLVHMQDVANNCKDAIHANLATIEETADSAIWPVGTRCIALSYGDEENFESILFIDMDDKNRIRRIYLSSDTTYRFQVEWPGTGKIKKPLTKDDIMIGCINSGSFDRLLVEMVQKCLFRDLNGNEVTGRENILKQLEKLAELLTGKECRLLAKKGRRPGTEKYYTLVYDADSGERIGVVDVRFMHNKIEEIRLFNSELVPQLGITTVE